MALKYVGTPFGPGLSIEQRICADPFVWNDGFDVFADQCSLFLGPVKHVAVQFRRRSVLSWPLTGAEYVEPGCNPAVSAADE
jgi:hypothetical protein